MKKKRGEKVVSGDDGSAVVGYPSSSTSGCCGGEECCGVGASVGGGEVRVGGVLGGGDSRFIRMGGGTASSSDELDGDSGVCAVGEGGCFEFVWQKWKKLLKQLSDKTFEGKNKGTRWTYSRSALSFLCSTALSMS